MVAQIVNTILFLNDGHIVTSIGLDTESIISKFSVHTLNDDFAVLISKSLGS